MAAPTPADDPSPRPADDPGPGDPVLAAAMAGVVENIAEQRWTACTGCLPEVACHRGPGGRWATSTTHEAGCIEMARQMIYGPGPAPTDIVTTPTGTAPATDPSTTRNERGETA